MKTLVQRQLLFLYLSGTCSAAGDLVLCSSGLKPGGVLTFDIVATRVPATANAVVAIEFNLGEQVMSLRTLKMANANYWYKTRGPVRVPSDWSVRLTFSDAGDSKLCEVSVYGYIEYPEE